MPLTQGRPVCDRRPLAGSTRKPIVADIEQDDCCCDDGGPPPPDRQRFVPAILCNPLLHTLHPEIPLIVFIPADSVCPGPTNPVFKHNFICYRVGSFTGPLYVQCTPDRPHPDTGTSCLPDDAVFGLAASGCWPSCEDDRCTKFFVLGTRCQSCGLNPETIECVYFDVRELSVLMGSQGPGFPTGCVVMAINDRCYQFTESGTFYNIDELPNGCQTGGVGPFRSCCVCAVQNQADGKCTACFGSSATCVSDLDDSYKQILCPPQTPTGKVCCCGPGSFYTASENILTITRNGTDTSYQRDTNDATYPGNFHWKTENSTDGINWTTVLEYNLTVGQACGWMDPYCNMYRVSCVNGDPLTTYTPSASGDCNNLTMDWTYSQTNQSGSFSQNQTGSIRINGTPGSAACTAGCGDVAGPGLAQRFLTLNGSLLGCLGCGGFLPNVPEED